jgi:threonine/homoserine/homoserine lactone efflux protein
MIETVGEFLPYAVGVAVSPIPIAAVILMLFTNRAKTNAPLFLAGWTLGIAVVGAAVLLIPGLGPSDSEPSVWNGVAKGVFGLLLLFMAVKTWRSRPAKGETADPPAWMSKIDEFTPRKAFGLAFLLAAVNPKNLLLTAGGAVVIEGASLTGSQNAAALAIFVIIAASTVWIPVIGFLILGDRIDNVLTATKDWLIQNNNTVTFVILLLLATLMLGDAAAILF